MRGRKGEVVDLGFPKIDDESLFNVVGSVSRAKGFIKRVLVATDYPELVNQKFPVKLKNIPTPVFWQA